MGVKIAPVVDTLDTVPEMLRDRYEERDGKFVLSQEIEIETPDTVAGLRSSFEKEKRERKTLADRLKMFDGMDPDEIRAVMEERSKAGEKDAQQKGEWDKLKAALEAGFNKEKTALTEKLNDRSARLNRLLAKTEADAAMQEFKANAKALAPHVLGALKVEEEDGEFRVLVVDDNGKPRYNKRGELMTAKDLVSEMREDDAFKPFFAGAPGSGSGAEPRKGGGFAGGKVQVTQAQMRDPAFYRDLSERARKEGKAVFDMVNIVDG